MLLAHLSRWFISGGGGGGGYSIPIYDTVRMCVPNNPFLALPGIRYTIHVSLLFQNLYLKNPFFFPEWYMNGTFFWYPCLNAQIFAQIFS